MYGQSSVRLVDMKTGSVIREHKMADSDFGEGLTKLGDTCVHHQTFTAVCLTPSSKCIFPVKTLTITPKQELHCSQSTERAPASMTCPNMKAHVLCLLGACA